MSVYVKGFCIIYALNVSASDDWTFIFHKILLILLQFKQCFV